ncbi:MAG TPA: tetratricopeptide repeat protein [Bradyrhizobium sp.]|nr:tetratricopeptide repeat protein [Bradyrhizobium sp.]
MTIAAPATGAANTEQATTAAANWLRIGDEYHDAGRNAAAIDAYGCGLAAVAAEPAGHTPVETIAELHSKLGHACFIGGDLESATTNYKSALRLKPDLTSCWCNLGNIYVRTGKAQDAIAYYLQALKISPTHWASRSNLVQALMATKQFAIARTLLEELIAERPQDAALHHQLGKAQFEVDNIEAALSSFEQALALNPRDADSYYWIGGIKQRLGDDESAYAAYAKAAQIQPLIRRPAIKSPADFRVLALYAPFGGNTPTEYLFKHAAYDTDTLALFEQSHYDAEILKLGVDVVVNLLSDVDQAARILPLAADLVQRLGKPVINDPRKILRTTRDATAELLTGIDGCRIPQIVRQVQGTRLSAEDIRAAFPTASSILVRPVGTHGGDDFDKLDSTAELAAYLAGPAATDRYFIEYADYGSADGHFRKYRFIFVGGEVLPYHLAIGNDWKVHHVNTDMANQEWMQQEEAAFLNDPTVVFNPRHYQALHEIQRRIGLDYFGIDCSIDTSGDLLVFEVNASMLVHDDNAQFPYKDPAVRRIKAAFDAMLAKVARAGA